ncbi:MAG TPA: STAS domain-containing protein [Phycisphaerales bacterium]|nr:STAS domain-containing protein [Phycisphaerales bacterium]
MATQWSENIVISDLGDEPELSEELNELYNGLKERAQSGVPNVVLNLAGVTYLNSSNIAQLLRIRRRLIECARGMKLSSVADSVWSIMLLTGLDKVFEFTPDKATAIAALQIQAQRGKA